MKKSSRQLFNYIPPAFLAVSLMAVYLKTMAPGLSWANNGADGGDLIAAAATQGVAHPTGYPTYLLLAQLFQLLPVGNLAYRVNLMSATATVAASLFIYELVTRYLSVSDKQRYWSPGLVSGFAIGLAPVVWSQAVIAEVYGLQALFVAIILYLSINLFPPTYQKRLDCLRGLTLGLAMGNHITTLLLVPIAILANVIHRSSDGSRWSWMFDWKSLLRQSVYLVVGLLVYLVLPLRAISNPPINWGNPVTFSRLWWLVSGQLYQVNLVPSIIGDAWIRLQAWASLLLQQFGLVGLIVALTGLVFFFTPSRLYFLTVWQMVAFSVFAIVYSSFDSLVYLIPAYISIAIWIGLGLGRLMGLGFLRLHRFNWMVSFMLILYLLGLATNHLPQVDASHDFRAESFGSQVLTTAPANAIVFAKGDRAVFAMWYFHFALRQRLDLVIIATDLMHFDWYQETLRAAYPSLVLPGPFPWPETVIHANPTIPVCYVEYSEQAMIDCKQPKDSY